MYAQLCVRLNELAPNFEDTSSSTTVTTFRRLLLAKCKEEFDNRTRSTSVDNDGLTLEERRGVAKRKMLGNIKFIGELFNLGMLHEKIIHQCIKELLEKKRSTATDVSDNTECLCHLLSTVGGKLDTGRAKGWVDQYFKRMKSLSKSEDILPRIKFMLIDVIELRENSWVPRKLKLVNDPKPIDRNPQTTYMYRPHPLPFNPSKLFMNNERLSLHQRKGEESSARPLVKSKTDSVHVVADIRKFPTGKKSDSTVSLRPSGPSKKFQQFKSSADNTKGLMNDSISDETSPTNNDQQINGSNEISVPQKNTLLVNSVIAPYSSPYPVMRHPSRHPFPFQPRQMMVPGDGPYSPHIKSFGSPLRYPHSVPYGQPPPHLPLYIHDLSNPPVPHAHGRPPSHQIIPNNGLVRPLNDVVTPPFGEHSRSPSNKRTTKSGKKGSSVGNRKNEPTKDEKIVIPIMERYLTNNDVTGMADLISGLSNVLPVNVITILMNRTINNSEDTRCEISKLFQELKGREYLTSTNFIKASSHVLHSLSMSDSTTALIRNAIAGYLARAVSQGLTSLTEITSLFTDGAHHPTLLVVLQALMNLIGQDRVQSKFQSEGIMMTSLLPTSQRSYEAISQMLETRNLGFLYPLKHIQTQLKSLLKKSDVSAVGVYKWLKANVDNQLFNNPEFIMLLTKSILGHVTNTSVSNPTVEKLSEEKRQMEQFKLIVQKLVHDDHSLQMTVVHSTQVFCNDLDFPKGLLLRLLCYWYEMDVIDDEVLLQWRENPSDNYPGKGKALFQVNQWLMLLAEADDCYDDDGERTDYDED